MSDDGVLVDLPRAAASARVEASRQVPPADSPERIPRSIQETQPVVGAGQLQYVYSDGANAQRTETTVPVIVPRDCCFLTQQALKAQHGLRKDNRLCHTCGRPRQQHMLAQHALSSLTVHQSAYPEQRLGESIELLQKMIEQVNLSNEPNRAPVGEENKHEGQHQQRADPRHECRSRSPSRQRGSHRSRSDSPRQRSRSPSRGHRDVSRERDYAPRSSLRPTTLVTADTPSAPATDRGWKCLSDVAKQLDSIKWSHASFARDFLSTIEGALEDSPVPPTQWIRILPMLIPKTNKNMLEWLSKSISKPSLSWNDAKSLFIKHYERRDWIDTQRIMYKDCTQGATESVQKYTDRFMMLADRLGYSDTQPLNIEHYHDGLKLDIQQQLADYRRQRRRIPHGVNDTMDPTWDFASLREISDEAISADVELSSIKQQRRPQSNLGKSDSNLANPRSKASHHEKRKTPSSSGTSPRKRSPKHCEFHPRSTNHHTSDCFTRNRGPGEVTTVQEKSKTTSTQPAVRCYTCNEAGHISPHCPKRKDKNDKSSPSPKHTFPKTRHPNARTVEKNKVTFKARSVQVKEDMHSDHEGEASDTELDRQE